MKHIVTDKEKCFTSTGEKLLYHTEEMKKFQNEAKATPIVLHIMPTSVCNLKCEFCSVKDRKVCEILNLKTQIIPLIKELKSRGLKAVIISGGGEPLLYEHFEKLIEFLYNNNLDIGLITNGTLLYKYDKELFEKLTWIRVSINSIEYGGKVNIPKLRNPTMGLSYIVTKKTTNQMLNKIKNLALENNLEYVRLLPDCVQPQDKIIEWHKKIEKIVKEFGSPFFHQYKVPSCPKNCFLGYFHPVLYCDGNIYPCDSLVLNDHDNQQFKESFMICNAKDIGKVYDNLANKSLVETKTQCPNCVFERQNNLLVDIKNKKIKISKKNELKDMKHINFI